MNVKIAGIEFDEQEINRIYFDGLKTGKRYIVKYNTIYALKWCENYKERGGVYATKIYHIPVKGSLPYVKRGYFIITDAKTVNELVGFKLLRVRGWHDDSNTLVRVQAHWQFCFLIFTR